MSRNTKSSLQHLTGAASKIFTLSKFPLILIVVVFVMIIFFIAPFTLLFSNNNLSTGSISNIGKAEIPQEYMEIYHAAEAKYNVPWNLLAAVHKEETKFGTMRPMVSPVGALGHMQFMCRTWAGWSNPGNSIGECSSSVDYTSVSTISTHGGYGVDANGDNVADPFEPEDAIFSAAKYLAAKGAATGKIEEALYDYNKDPEYVNRVLQFAESYVMSPELSPDGGLNVDIGESGFAWPATCTTNVTSSMAMRVHPVTGIFSQHKGADIAAAGCNKTPIIAALPGRIEFAGRAGTYGNAVYINHGGGMKTRYAHMFGIAVREGQMVQRGQPIGLLGSTGRSTNPHLHFEVRINGKAHDPLNFY